MTENLSIADASPYASLIPPSPDDTLVSSCDPDFVRTVVAGHFIWNNPTMDVQYSMTNANETCGHGVKAMLGQAVGGAATMTMFILISCPLIQSQTEGKPKMFRDLEGRNLVTNDRPDVD